MLRSGQQVGRYEIVREIGVGGMGEVYRARDPELGREVAVKVLPSTLADDRTGWLRLQREAKATSRLSHPNVLAVFDIGEHDGQPYIVYELLEGQTLRAWLDAGASPLRKVLEVATKIARGLGAAHEKGIVHRDLKPDNVIVTSDGQVKVLDFGLAKIQPKIDPEGTDTIKDGPSALTQPGVVMGTVGYMSPEQVRGRDTDQRSDIFAFGILLYEMLAGRLPFQGESAIETMSAILEQEPAALADFDRNLPPVVDRIVRHCLEKRPEDRFQSAHDLALALDSITTVSRSRAMAALEEAEDEPRARSARWGWAMLAVLPVVGIAGFLLGRDTAPETNASGTFRRLTDHPGVEWNPSISPDGGTFVYAARDGGDVDLFLQRIGGQRPINLTEDNPTDDTAPVFSPDGSRIAFRSERDGGGIFVMGATGESVRRLADEGYDPAWSPDGARLVTSTEPVTNPMSRAWNARIAVIAIDGGEPPRSLVEIDAVEPSWSPSGERIVFWGVREASLHRDLWTVSVDQGALPIALTDDVWVDWNPVWSPDGGSVFFASNRGGIMGLWVLDLDPSSGERIGEPRPLPGAAQWSSGISLSRDGRRVLFSALDERSSLFVTDPRNPTARATVLAGSRLIRDIDLSADGQRVVFSSGGSREDLYAVEVDGSGYRKITDDEPRDRAPRWAPGSDRVTFYSSRTSPLAVWGVQSDGSDLSKVWESEGMLWYPVWSPDGRRIAANADDGVRLVDLETGAETVVPLPDDETVIEVSAWSLDGRFLVGWPSPAVSTRSEVWRFDLETSTWALVVTGCVQPDVDGFGTIYCKGRDGIYRVEDARGSLELVVPVSPGSIAELRWTTFGVSDDGSRLVYAESTAEGDVWLLELE